MWTIGRSQRVEEKKYRPIVRKIRYIIFDKLWQCMLDTAECDKKNSGYSKIHNIDCQVITCVGFFAIL